MAQNLLLNTSNTYQLAEFVIEFLIYLLTSWYFSTSLQLLKNQGSNSDNAEMVPFLTQMDITIFKLSLAQALL